MNQKQPLIGMAFKALKSLCRNWLEAGRYRDNGGPPCSISDADADGVVLACEVLSINGISVEAISTLLRDELGEQAIPFMERVDAHRERCELEHVESMPAGNGRREMKWFSPSAGCHHAWLDKSAIIGVDHPDYMLDRLHGKGWVIHRLCRITQAVERRTDLPCMGWHAARRTLETRVRLGVDD